VLKHASKRRLQSRRRGVVQRTLSRGPRIHHLPLASNKKKIYQTLPHLQILLLGVFSYVPLTHRSQEAEQRYSCYSCPQKLRIKRAAGISILLAFTYTPPPLPTSIELHLGVKIKHQKPLKEPCKLRQTEERRRG